MDNIFVKTEEAMSHGRMVTGRQIAWMIWDWFKTDIHKSTFSNFEDINGLCWKGDTPSQMEQFLQDWDYLIDNLGPNTMTIDAQRDMFHSTWCKSTVLKEDIAHYKRARAKGPGVDPDFTIEFMIQTIAAFCSTTSKVSNFCQTSLSLPRREAESCFDMLFNLTRVFTFYELHMISRGFSLVLQYWL